MKTCKKCGSTKSESEFYKSSTYSDGFQSQCKACALAYAKRRYPVVKDRKARTSRAWRLRKWYGLSTEEYQALWQRQQGRCAGCDKTEEEIGQQFSVDHCHQTGQVRGLLCNSCNLALGYAADSVGTLCKLAGYLRSCETYHCDQGTSLGSAAPAGSQSAST